MQSSKQTVHRHENTSDVSLAAMIRYAAILDVRVEELLADSMRIPPTLSTLVKIADKLKPEQQALLTRLGNQIAQPDDLNNGDTPPASQAN